MATATISRGSTSVDLELIAPSGTPLVSKDVGRPHLELKQNGELNPRHADHYSGLVTYTILGRFTGTDAYSNAITLADLIKSNSNGTALELDIGLSEFESNMTVCPAAGQDQAVSFNYPTGKANTVEVDLGLTRVNQTLGGSSQPASTPTATGSGPITLSRGSQSVELVNDVTVSRSLGRPQSQIKETPNARFPNHYEKTKTAYEGFELSLQFNKDTVTKINKIGEMFSRRLNRRSLDLNFNGLYGLGSFSVVPPGSGALRHVRQSARKDTMMVPTISLQRVLDTQ